MKSFLSIQDLTSEEVKHLLSDASAIKSISNTSSWAMSSYPNWLEGKNIVLYFEKPSLRTHLTFDIAISKMGGHSVYYDNSASLNRESSKDMIRCISKWADAIVARVYNQGTLEVFDSKGDIPVINALSDKSHPCQALADFMTIAELTKKDFEDIKVAYIGEPNNVSNSLMVTAAKLGSEFTLVCPPCMSPDFVLYGQCKELSGGKTKVNCDIMSIENYDVIYCDTWYSMGDTTNSNLNKEIILQPYQVTKKLVESLHIPYVLHCLPAHCGQEITEEVMDEHGEIYQLAENRMWTEMAILKNYV